MVRNWISSKTAELSSSKNEGKISFHISGLNKMFKVSFMLTWQWHLRVILCFNVSSLSGRVMYFKCTLTFTRAEARPRGFGLRPKQNTGTPWLADPYVLCYPWQSHKLVALSLRLSKYKQNTIQLSLSFKKLLWSVSS